MTQRFKLYLSYIVSHGQLCLLCHGDARRSLLPQADYDYCYIIIINIRTHSFSESFIPLKFFTKFIFRSQPGLGTISCRTTRLSVVILAVNGRVYGHVGVGVSQRVHAGDARIVPYARIHACTYTDILIRPVRVLKGRRDSYITACSRLTGKLYSDRY